jgi:hypothetical protein
MSVSTTGLNITEQKSSPQEQDLKSSVFLQAIDDAIKEYEEKCSKEHEEKCKKEHEEIKAKVEIRHNITEEQFYENCRKYYEESSLKNRNTKCHFLSISGIDYRFLYGNKPSLPSEKEGSFKAVAQLIRIAIWNFFQVFNVDRYIQDGSPSDIERVIWRIFRDLEREWKVGRSDFITTNKDEASMKAKKERERGHLKRQEKIKSEITRLGGGNMEMGADLFNQRMHIQKTEKNNKVVPTSVGLEEKFLAWLDSPAAKMYSSPMVCSASTRFKQYTTEIFGNKIVTMNFNVNSIEGVLDAVRKLSLHKNSSDISIKGILRWDESIPYTNPSSHVCYDSLSFSALAGHKMFIQGYKFQILGYSSSYNRGSMSPDYYIVSDEISSVYRNFPQEYSAFEYRNPKTSSRMKVLYKVTHSLSSIECTRVDGNITYILNISYVKGVEQSRVDAVTSLFDPCIAQLKAQSIAALTEKTKERDIKNNVARVLGRFKSNKDIDDILKRELCDLFTNSHITREQFMEAMKV